MIENAGRRDVLDDPLTERRVNELWRLARAKLAPLIREKAKGRVVVTIDLEGGHVTWLSGVAQEEKPLTKG